MRAKFMYEKKITKHRDLSKLSIIIAFFLKYLAQFYILKIHYNYAIQ